MSETFDFIVVGAGSAGAVIAARLSEDPSCRVVLLEAGGRPPVEEMIPAACSSMQQNPQTDWMYTADAGKCGLALKGGRMMMPRGKMLGGSSGINYMAYVRGHPGDFRRLGKRRRQRLELPRRAAVLQEERRAHAERGHLDRCIRAQHCRSPWGVRACAGIAGRARVRGCRCGGRYPARRLQRTRPWRPGRRRVALSDLNTQRQTVEHVPRVPRGRCREATESHHHHGRAGHACSPGGRGGSTGCHRRRISHWRW